MKYYAELPDIRFIAYRDSELKDRAVYRRIWSDAMKLDPVIGSRRNWRKEAEKLDWLEGCFVFADGCPFSLERPAQEVFDIGNRWWSQYVKTDASGRRPNHYMRCYEKVRRTHLIVEVWKWEGKFPH